MTIKRNINGVIKTLGLEPNQIIENIFIRNLIQMSKQGFATQYQFTFVFSTNLLVKLSILGDFFSIFIYSSSINRIPIKLTSFFFIYYQWFMSILDQFFFITDLTSTQK